MTTELERRFSRHDERQLLAQLLEAVQQSAASTSEALDRLRRHPRNTVLLNELVTVGTTGVVTRRPGMTIGSALVFNYTAADVYCKTGSPDATAPTQGVGVVYVPVGTWLAFPVDDTDLTVYANPSSGKVTIQLFTGMIAYGTGGIA